MEFPASTFATDNGVVNAQAKADVARFQKVPLTHRAASFADEALSEPSCNDAPSLIPAVAVDAQQAAAQQRRTTDAAAKKTKGIRHEPYPKSMPMIGEVTTPPVSPPRRHNPYKNTAHALVAAAIEHVNAKPRWNPGFDSVFESWRSQLHFDSSATSSPYVPHDASEDSTSSSGSDFFFSSCEEVTLEAVEVASPPAVQSIPSDVTRAFRKANHQRKHVAFAGTCELDLDKAATITVRTKEHLTPGEMLGMMEGYLPIPVLAVARKGGRYVLFTFTLTREEEAASTEAGAAAAKKGGNKIRREGGSGVPERKAQLLSIIRACDAPPADMLLEVSLGPVSI